MKIGVIGHFGGENQCVDGQTVKTKTLTDGLREKYPEDFQITEVDTYYVRRKPARFWGDLFRCLRTCPAVVVLLSRKGRGVLFPVLGVAARLFGVKVYHCAIGGRLGRETREKRGWKSILNRFQVNWVEGKCLAEELQQLGVTNAVYQPNFKLLEPLEPAQLHRAGSPLRFCTFSRVMKEKGISDAIEAVQSVNRAAGAPVALLDIYGPVSENYRQEFEEKLAGAKDCARYCGVIDPNRSVDALRQDDLLLFPTTYWQEGVPGTIIDAFAAGLPVIARDWRYCKEMITHQGNGLVYESDRPDQLVVWIQWAVEHPEEVDRMRPACLEAARGYSADAVLPEIREALLRGAEK